MSTLNLQVAIAATMDVPASTEALVASGAQNAYVGEEIVGVVDATDLGSGQYQVGPDLVRGMRGSPTSGHQAGETFAAAPTVGSTTKVFVDPKYVGQRVYARAISPGQDIDDAVEVSCVIVAPKSPYLTKLPTSIDETPTGTIDGTNATFALTHAPISGTLSVYANGALLPSSAYSLSGTTLVFATAPASGTALDARYQYSS